MIDTDDHDGIDAHLARAQQAGPTVNFLIGVLALILAAAAIDEVLSRYLPARDCIQIGEYTCVDRY
jgi:hypothetical protein